MVMTHSFQKCFGYIGCTPFFIVKKSNAGFSPGNHMAFYGMAEQVIKVDAALADVACEQLTIDLITLEGLSTVFNGGISLDGAYAFNVQLITIAQGLEVAQPGFLHVAQHPVVAQVVAIIDVGDHHGDLGFK